jgi:hypothetical protein
MSQMAPGIPLSPEGRVTTAERLVLEELRAIRAGIDRLVAHTYAAEQARAAQVPQRPAKGLSPALRQGEKK